MILFWSVPATTFSTSTKISTTASTTTTTTAPVVVQDEELGMSFSD